MPSRAGSPNKNKQALIALLQEKYPGYQPVMDMAEAAIELSKTAREAKSANDPEAASLWRDASAAHDRVAAYVTPKLKAVEVSTDQNNPPRLVIEWAANSE